MKQGLRLYTYRRANRLFLYCSASASLQSALSFASVSGMASNSIKLGLFLFALLLLSSPVLCDDDEGDNLLEDINNYRKSLNLPALQEKDQASCVADEIADDLEDQPCKNMHDYYPVPGGSPKFNLEKLAKKCKIDFNTTADGVIMPVCVPNLEPRSAVLSNYTNSSHYTKYVNNSEYTGAGVGSEDDWIVLILTTNTSTGSFSAATSLFAHACKAHYLAALILASLFVLIY